MSLCSVYDKLNNIKKTPSTIEKIELLKEHLQDPIFKQVIELMYDGRKHYKINKFEVPFHNDYPRTHSELFKFLKTLAKQKGASDKDKLHLGRLSGYDGQTVHVVERIINKDAKCGFSGKTINKAMPGLIYLMPYCRCSTEKKIDKIVYPAYAQQKADGMFVNVIIRNKTIKFLTRNGKKVNFLGKLKKAIRKNLIKKYKNVVYHGELLVSKNGKILERKTGNGILNSCIQNSQAPPDAKNVVLRLWDAIPLKDFNEHKCDIKYKYRLRKCKAFVNEINSQAYVQLIKTKVVHSYTQARKFYGRIRNDGGEGVILKNFFMLWKYHTSTDAIKLKNTSECELRVITIATGKKGTKYAGMIGSLGCKSKDGRIKVSVGSGLSDKDRKRDFAYFLDKIVRVEFESVISDKRNKDLFSLFLPRYVEMCVDRGIADTYKDIVER